MFADYLECGYVCGILRMWVCLPNIWNVGMFVEYLEKGYVWPVQVITQHDDLFENCCYCTISLATGGWDTF